MHVGTPLGLEESSALVLPQLHKVSSSTATLTEVFDGKKVYRVSGATFEVDEHYEVLDSIGYGSYGAVCSALDLRLIPDRKYYDKWLTKRRELGGGCVRKGEKVYRIATIESLGEWGKSIHVGTLRYEPWTQATVSNGVHSAFVAIKKVNKVFDNLLDGRRVLREIKMLRYLAGHPNIVRLHDLFYPARLPETFQDLYIVTELADTDLSLIIDSHIFLDAEQQRYVMYQLFKCLVYVHSSGVIHRDLKPANLLLSRNLLLKVCDFGLSRGGLPLGVCCRSSYEEEQNSMCYQRNTSRGGGNPYSTESPVFDLTDYVVTRFYRSPELLIMSQYNAKVDIWAAGCIMAEMIRRRPIFSGSNYLTQLTLQLMTPGLRGIPSNVELLDAAFIGGAEGKSFIKELLFRGDAKGHASFGDMEQLRCALFGPRAIPDGLMSLLSRLLSFDPAGRPSAVEALRDPYFASYYRPADELIRCSCASDDLLVETSSVEKNRMDFQNNDNVESYSEYMSVQGSWEMDHRLPVESELRSSFQKEIDYFVHLKAQQQLSSKEE